MTAKAKRKIYFGVFWVILVTSFIFFASLIVLVTNGYHFNWQNFHLERTGMLILNGPADGLKITLNGKEKSGNLPIRYSQLFPGPYVVVATKDGYSTWEKSYKIIGGQAVVVDNLILYLKNIQPAALGNDTQTIQNINNNYKNQSADLTIKNDELWRNNALITRYSRPISAAIFDGSNGHFYLQVGDEIHALDSDGRNDILLFKLTDGAAAAISVNNNTLTYAQNNQAYSATIW